MAEYKLPKEITNIAYLASEQEVIRRLHDLGLIEFVNQPDDCICKYGGVLRRINDNCEMHKDDSDW